MTVSYFEENLFQISHSQPAIYRQADPLSSCTVQDSSNCRGVGWGVEGKQVGSMDEESQGRGCYNITFICTPTNQETV